MSRELTLSGPALSQGWMGNGGRIPPCPSPLRGNSQALQGMSQSVPRYQLKTTPIGCASVAFPGNLLIPAPCTGSLPFPVSPPKPYQCVLERPSQQITCLLTLVSGTILRALPMALGKTGVILLTTHFGRCGAGLNPFRLQVQSTSPMSSLTSTKPH